MAVNRATLIDIARQAGVSTATVDRVLNRRPGVRERTRDVVFQTANRLGYPIPMTGPATGRAALPIDLLLPDGDNLFIRNLADAFETAAIDSGEVELRIHYVKAFDPNALAEALFGLIGKSKCIGLIAVDHPLVREALRQVHSAGTHLVTLISDISNVPHEGYVGIDNRAAGRLGGYLLGRFLPKTQARLALFAGSLSYRGHEEREMGFRHILREDFLNLSVVELREIHDDDERAYREAQNLLAQYPDLAGIYNIGGGNRGIARALEEAGRGRDIIFIGHELTEYTRRLLLSGIMDAVIDQNPRAAAREAIDLLTRCGRGDAVTNLPPIRVQAIFRENIHE